MPDTNRELKTALSTIDERWDSQRTERTLSVLQRKRQQSRRQRRALAVVGTVCAGAALAFAVRRTSEPPVQPMAAVVQTPLHMQLADGSDVSLRDAAAQVIVDEVTPSRVALALLTGQARFDVLHREDRVFRVRSGDVTIEVLGTTFEVEREAARTRVSVLRGRVAVSWPSGRAELAAGEAGWFPRVEEPEAAPADMTPHNPKRAAHKPGVVSSVGAVGTVGAAAGTNAWREPAEQGDFEHAYELLEHAPQPVADNVEELLLAADTARLSGHAAAALPFLKRVVAEHAHDSRAPLAAFTLGGVLMQQLGQPREAEIAYARARELSLNSSLAEDALARQVEAAYRAGDASRARTLASEYLTRYPKGRRIHAVQRFGGLVR